MLRMGILEKFLDDNKEELVEFVQSNQRPIPIGDNIYGRLLEELTRQIPLTKNGVHNVLDKAHIELCIAIIESMWCGWLSQAKANKNVYSKDHPDIFKEAICDAFEIGQEYAAIRP